ncbi:sulfate ABC transporter substrate-binding protein [Wenjunlia vitaminophila]|uniref:Sulfate ABC transporter substrate-binding protein n=1 Tax=Wenjunlia vitaminophila TaxID=76728 RepID=A0A0T6LZA2_WENVI|nr:aliphatic sulfonate ABC transporter substrate-binding protein [Wenjunlia vitaminophila]KRV51352.1 sulfate ABC transporter substrate-binding protein [Wenjunlia vitaminophila]
MAPVRPTRSRTTRPRRALALVLFLPLVAALGACGYGSRADDGDGEPAPVAAGAEPLSTDQVRLGYFANVTHATPLVGLEKGLIAKELGGTRIKRQVFNAGPAAIEALNAGSIDMSWIGPSPSINGYVRSHGENLRIVAGATSGGASLVVNPDRVRDRNDLEGKRIATPQLGNTQDVALLNYLSGHGYRVDAQTGAGDVKVIRQDNKEIPNSFRRGDLDGAWVPEPTAAKLVSSGGKVLLDERELWPGGRFVTTNLIVSQSFLEEHPDVVEAVLRGSVRTNAWINQHPDQAKATLNSALGEQTGKPLPDEVLDQAFAQVEILDDPLAGTLRDQAEHAVEAGLLDEADLSGIYDLTLLNTVLREEGRATVDDAGLGVG